MDWEAKAAEKRSRAFDSIPKEWRLPAGLLSRTHKPLETSRNNLFELDAVKDSGILTQKELEITEKYNVPELLDGLAKGYLSAVEVVTASSKRATIAQQLVWGILYERVLPDLLKILRQAVLQRYCLIRHKKGLGF